MSSTSATRAGVAEAPAQTVPKKLDHRIATALRLIEASLGEEIDYIIIAETVGLSLHRFHHLFAEEMGTTPGGYLRRVRMDAAALRLRWTKESAGDIANGLGYESQSSFTKAFKERFGVAPGRFRKDHQRWPNVPVEEIKDRRVSLREADSFRCIAKRYFGPYKIVHKHWRDFLGRLPPGMEQPGRSLFVGLVYDDPRFTPPDQIRYDCCITVTDAYAEPDPELAKQGFHALTTRAGLYACVSHVGTYRTIGRTYSLILDNWLVKSRYTLVDDPAMEVYAVPQTRVVEEDLRFTIMLGLY